MLKLKQSPRHSIDILFPFMLLMLFSTVSILLIFFGAKQYEAIANRMAVNYELRTAAAYLEEKINQKDVSGSFSLTTIGSSDAIALTETVMKQKYTTYIYVYEGYLREICVFGNDTFAPEKGTPIMEAFDFSISAVSENLYKCSFTVAPGTASRNIPPDVSADNFTKTSDNADADGTVDLSMVTCTLYISLNAESETLITKELL